MSPIVQSGPGIAPTATNARVYAPAGGGRAGRATSDVAAGHETSGARTIPASSFSPVMWAVAVLIEMNRIHPSKRPIPITVQNVETLLRPITGEGSLTQQGGFLRDNNPWNIGTGCSPTGAYGGTPNAPFGPDARCGGGPVYLNTFASVFDGIRATAQYLVDNGTYTALANKAPASLVLSKTWYKGDAKAASAVPVRAEEVVAAVEQLGGNVAAAAGTVDQGLAHDILHWLGTSGRHAGFPPNLKARLLALSAADREATITYVQAIAQKEGITYHGLFAHGNPLGLGTQITNAAKSAVGATERVIPGLNVAQGIGSLASELGGFSKLFNELTHINWVRVGIFLGGAVLVIGGITVYVATSEGPKILESRVP